MLKRFSVLHLHVFWPLFKLIKLEQYHSFELLSSKEKKHNMVSVGRARIQREKKQQNVQ